MSNIRLLLTQAGIPFREKGSNVGREMVNISCIFCNESRYHLGIHETDYWFNCFVCGEKGKWEKLRNKLRQHAPNVPWNCINKENVNYTDDEKAKEKVSQAQKIFWRQLSSKDKQLKDWLENTPENIKDAFRPRGVSLSTAKEFGLMAGIDKLRGYAVFKNSEIVVARKFIEKEPGPRWWKDGKGLLFGSEYTKKVQPEIGIITEGVFEVLRIPIGHSVAILGSVFTDTLIDEITNAFPNSKKLILALDRDVKNKTYEKYILTLQDLGYLVERVNWDEVDEGVKDLDELYFSKNNKIFFSWLKVPELAELSYKLV